MATHSPLLSPSKATELSGRPNPEAFAAWARSFNRRHPEALIRRTRGGYVEKRSLERALEIDLNEGTYGQAVAAGLRAHAEAAE